MKTFFALLEKLLSLLNSLFNRTQRKEEDIKSAQDKQEIAEQAEKAAQDVASSDEKKKQDAINEMRELISD